MAFSFVHTADLHLDSPLRSLALRDPHLCDLIGTATRAALTRIIDLCLEERVDALLVAGDLYDGAQTSMKTARFLVQQFGRLDAAGIRVFLIRGNHDAESRITRELVFPPSVTVFGSRPGMSRIDSSNGSIAIHGLSFRDRHAPHNLLDRFAPPLPDAVNIGMLHTSLGGASGHDPYAPCTVAELQATGYDYWALGHIHQRSAWSGRTTVVMPGMPQGRDIGEAGEKSVTLVRIGADGTVALETRSIAIARFARLPVDLSGAQDWAGIVRMLEAAVSAARRSMSEDHLVVRPVLTGDTPLAARVLRDLDLLSEQAQAAAEAIGSVWIDRVEAASGLRAGRMTFGPGPLSELAGLIGAVVERPAVDAQVAAEIGALLRVLPAELRDLLDADTTDPDTARADLMQAGATEILAHLQDGPTEASGCD